MVRWIPLPGSCLALLIWRPLPDYILEALHAKHTAYCLVIIDDGVGQLFRGYSVPFGSVDYMAARVLIIGLIVACAAVEAVADQTPRPYAAAAPPTDAKGTKSEATETPREIGEGRRLSHGAPHCVQDGAFVEDACDLCYGGCHACWVYLSDTNQVA